MLKFGADIIISKFYFIIFYQSYEHTNCTVRRYEIIPDVAWLIMLIFLSAYSDSLRSRLGWNIVLLTLRAANWQKP